MKTADSVFPKTDYIMERNLGVYDFCGKMLPSFAFYSYDKHLYPKQPGERRIDFRLQLAVLYEMKSGQEPKAGRRR